MPDDVREQICRRTVRAALDAKILDSFSLPDDGSRPTPSTVDFLAQVLADFLGMWDTVYHRAAEGWPHPPQALGGFVLGRQAVLDLAIRTAALMHLCNAGNPEGLAIAAPSDTAGRDLLNHLQEVTGKELTREGLAKALNVPDKSTIDHWYAGTSIPNREHIWALAKFFATPRWPRYQLRRWIRVQYALIAIGGRLEEVLGHHWAHQLLGMFAILLDYVLTYHQATNRPRVEFLRQQREAIRLGIYADGSAELLNVLPKWLDDLPADSPIVSEIWVDDIAAAKAHTPHRRLEACFSVIGDWPKDVARFDTTPHTAAMPLAERREFQEGASLLAMAPTWLEKLGPQVNASGLDLEWAQSLGWQWLQAGQPDKAAPLLRHVAEANPRDAMLICSVGMALVRGSHLEQLEEGRKYLRRALQLRPEWDYPLAELARSHFHREEYERVLEVLDGAPPELTTASTECTFERARALCELQCYREALVVAEKTTALDPGYAEAWALAADLASLLKDGERVRRYYKQAKHLGFTTVRRSGIAFPYAICPIRAAAVEPFTSHTSGIKGANQPAPQGGPNGSLSPPGT